MGCVSSKMAREDRRKEREPELDGGFSGGGGLANHIVSLTSSTYGVLKLDREDAGEAAVRQRWIIALSKAPAEEPEIINAWELMEDLDDEIPMIFPAEEKTAAKAKPVGGAAASPVKHLLSGKENRHRTEPERTDLVDPCRVLKPVSPPSNGRKSATPKSSSPFKSTPQQQKIQGYDRDSSSTGRRKSFSSRSPLFDPELVAFFEKEHCEGGAQIKKVISVTPRRQKGGSAASCPRESTLQKKCPPGGEEAVVLYTTTLRGIRKTFDDCNDVRAAVESHGVQIVERDISMDSGFREELRLLMGKRDVRVPVLFVRGGLVGGAEEVLKMEEDGRLAKLLAGIPRAARWCDGCGGMRFVLCMDCSGSRKVFDDGEKKTVRCGECNENGLILCPICG